MKVYSKYRDLIVNMRFLKSRILHLHHTYPCVLGHNIDPLLTITMAKICLHT